MNRFLLFSLLILQIQSSLTDFPFDPQPAEVIDDSCLKHCKTKYGTVIGEHNSIKAYSNCNDHCSNDNDPGSFLYKSKTGLIEDVYTGMRWQCVEYARRYLIASQKVNFGSVADATDIYKVMKVKDLTKENKTFPFDSYDNGNENEPKEGDLIIFKKGFDSKYGHVAVVTYVDLERYFIGIGEQNLNNEWIKKDLYSRRLYVIVKNGKYFLYENPFSLDDSFLSSDFDMLNTVTGWKRVRRDN